MKRSKIAPAENNIFLICLAIGMIVGSLLSLISGKIEFEIAGICLGLIIGNI